MAKPSVLTKRNLLAQARKTLRTLGWIQQEQDFARSNPAVASGLQPYPWVKTDAVGRTTVSDAPDWYTGLYGDAISDIGKANARRQSTTLWDQVNKWAGKGFKTGPPPAPFRDLVGVGELNIKDLKNIRAKEFQALKEWHAQELKAQNVNDNLFVKYGPAVAGAVIGGPAGSFFQSAIAGLQGNLPGAVLHGANAFLGGVGQDFPPKVQNPFAGSPGANPAGLVDVSGGFNAGDIAKLGGGFEPSILDAIGLPGGVGSSSDSSGGGFSLSDIFGGSGDKQAGAGKSSGSRSPSEGGGGGSVIEDLIKGRAQDKPRSPSEGGGGGLTTPPDVRERTSTGGGSVIEDLIKGRAQDKARETLKTGEEPDIDDLGEQDDTGDEPDIDDLGEQDDTGDEPDIGDPGEQDDTKSGGLIDALVVGLLGGAIGAQGLRGERSTVAGSSEEPERQPVAPFAGVDPFGRLTRRNLSPQEQAVQQIGQIQSLADMLVRGGFV